MHELPASDYRANSGQELAQQHLHGFLYHEGLAKIAAIYGCNDLPQSPIERLAVLSELATTHWDFRRTGAERWAVSYNVPTLDREGPARDRALDAIAHLGMDSLSRPSDSSPQCLAIFGGGFGSSVKRLRYGMEVVHNFDYLVYLGSSRQLSEGEKASIHNYAPQARTEFDLGCGILATLPKAEVIEEMYQGEGSLWWGMRRLQFEDRNGLKKQGFVLDVPKIIATYPGSMRPSTYDNLLSLLALREHIGELPTASVVTVTNSIYSWAQHLVNAYMLMTEGIQVETIGYNAEYSGESYQIGHYLQEIKAAIDAACRLQGLLEQGSETNELAAALVAERSW